MPFFWKKWEVPKATPEMTARLPADLDLRSLVADAQKSGYLSVRESEAAIRALMAESDCDDGPKDKNPAFGTGSRRDKVVSI